MEPLPIDPYLPALISNLSVKRNIILSAAPGAGKTTRVPRALYDAGLARDGEILILEPRRLAARLAATRVAHELGEDVGNTVGYSIRFESVAGPHTRIRFLTEAILARRMITDPGLRGISTVILDEFHERHLATDLALSFLKQLQTRNLDLRIIVMSATLDVEPIASFLEDTCLMSVPGLSYDVAIEYEAKESNRPLHEKIASAASQLSRSGLNGDVLVFLPGAAEIRRAAEALRPISERFGFSVVPLHGDLSSAEQARAVGPSEHRKLILATNVAETSITIPGIAAVIDSGLSRGVAHNPWSGLPSMSTSKISRASAIQRAGRAGRTQAGRVLRLYTRPDFESRHAYDAPQIKRADLAETCLMLHGAGVRDVHDFQWFEEPPGSSIESAEALLQRLGAIDNKGRMTAAGIQMLHLPVHPRLARLLVEGKRRNVAENCALLAALISERDIRIASRTTFGSKVPETAGASGSSDLLEMLDSFRQAEEARFAPGQLHDLGLDPAAVRPVRQAQRQLRQILKIREGTHASSAEKDEESLLISILAAFPDRVCKRRKPGSRDLLLAGGGSAVLSPASVLHHHTFAVAVDAEERRGRNSQEQSGTVVRIASAIEIEWLADLFPDELLEKSELIWNERAGRVDESRITLYGQIALEERVNPAARTEKTSAFLVSKVLADKLSCFRDTGSLYAFHARLALVSSQFPDERYPMIGDQEIRSAVEQICEGRRSIEEISHISILDVLKRTLTCRQQSLLEKEAPEKLKLKGGRSVKIHYEQEKPPWIESRLQDFFGMNKTPAVCAERIPVTIHLLAPNGRAVQVTSDLEGFWKRHYPAIRRELQRRYPKHSWPELAGD